MQGPPTTKPSARDKRLYRMLLDRYGEPDHLITFDPAQQAGTQWLGLLSVAVWDADEDCDVTTCQTIGMSDRRMIGASYDAELHFGYRGLLVPQERSAVSQFLADVAVYPFMNGVRLDWWERVSAERRIPLFSSCEKLLLRPPFLASGMGTVQDDGDTIKILYVVPITPQEDHWLAVHGTGEYERQLEARGIDVLLPHADEVVE